MTKHKAKRASRTSHKKTTQRVAYKQGKNILAISYDTKNGMLGFDLVAKDNKIGEFHVKGTSVMQIMGLPLIIPQS